MIEKYIYINNFVSHSFVFMSIFQKYNRSVSCSGTYHIFNPYIIVIHVVYFLLPARVPEMHFTR